jgi:prolyl-tRNA synthetase
LKGVPLRLEVGPRDLAEGNVTLVWRHLNKKEAIPVSTAVKLVAEQVDVVQAELLASATTRRDERTAECSSLDDVREATQNGFARVPWSLVGVEGEAMLAEDAITVRCLQRADGSVPAADDEPDLVAFCARAY